MNNLPTRTRILFIDHTSVLGGGELALLALVRTIDSSLHQPKVLVFSNGPLAEEMQTLADTVVLTLPDELLGAKRTSMRVQRLPVKEVVMAIRFLYQLRKQVRLIKPDLIHTNSLKSNLLGGIVARLCGIPVVWHVRDRIHQDYLPRPAVFLIRALCKIIPNAIIANSASTLATLGLPDTPRAVAISSGMDLLPFIASGKGSETIGQATALGHVVNIAMIGRLASWKGQEVFLRAAAKVHEDFPLTHYYIVGCAMFGDTDQERVLRDLVATLHMTEYTTFMGFQRDIPAVIGRMHLIVHASIIPEPFGQVIVQGMAAGKPVIASAGGGASEIIEHGVTGFLTSRGDHDELARTINKILAAPDESELIAAEGQRRAISLYEATSTTRSVEQVYKSLLYRPLAHSDR
jgi:glycosyltransferase involved in cell wall biosynthesis